MCTTDNSIGSYSWGLKTGGNLSSFARLSWSIQVIAIQLKRQFSSNKKVVPINIDPSSIQIPDSRLVQTTLEYISDVHSPSLRNHCLRTYVLGEIFGQHEKLNYDSEVFALSAFLHDLGLEEKHCQLHKNIHCFAIEGAMEAGLYLETQGGISEEKIKIVQDSIALHLNLRIPEIKAEAYLLNKASATDTIGLHRHLLDRSTRQALLERYPNLGMAKHIDQLLKKQNAIRPKSRMHFLYKFGFGGLLLENRFVPSQRKVLS